MSNYDAKGNWSEPTAQTKSQHQIGCKCIFCQAGIQAPPTDTCQECKIPRARLEKTEKDAERLNALLDMSTIEAQAVLWNCTNRKARLKVIDAAIAKERPSSPKT